MKQNKFDLVMDYIDENIKKDTEIIKKGIYNLIGIHSNTFGNHFDCLTGETLGSYIRKRRLFFAAVELYEQPQKPIVDIALDYGYSDQTAFTRAISSQYNLSPGELRNKRDASFLRDEKYLFDDFSEPDDSRSKRIWREYARTGTISWFNIEWIQEVEEGEKLFGFDIDTCYAIGDLAERLGVPVLALMEACFQVDMDCELEQGGVREMDYVAMELGVCSREDLQAICAHYGCKYYELNEKLVKDYYELDPQKKKGEGGEQ